MSTVVDQTTLTRNFVDMPKCRVGEEVALEKTHTSEIYRGKVIRLAKPNAYTLYIFVEKYFKETTLRERFKQRVVGFRNSRKIRIHRISESEHTKAQRAQARKAYSKHRNLLQDRREAAEEFITLLQSAYGCALDLEVSARMSAGCLKKLYRAVALDHHPDKLVKDSPERQAEGKKFMAAISDLKQLRERVLR